MSTPDNRVRLPAAKIDFTNDVGLSGGDHDSYPPEGGQARFDHMRMFLIGLLSQQSSFNEPSEKRDGTPWLDLNTNVLKIWINNDWHLYSDVVPVAEDDDGNVTTLGEWFASVSSALSSLAQEVTFSGSSTSNDVTFINIPESLRDFLYSDSRPIVYINGALVDPRNSRLEPGALPTAVKLSNVTLSSGDTFTVFIRRIPNSTFYTPNVSIP